MEEIKQFTVQESNNGWNVLNNGYFVTKVSGFNTAKELAADYNSNPSLAPEHFNGN